MGLGTSILDTIQRLANSNCPVLRANANRATSQCDQFQIIFAAYYVPVRFPLQLLLNDACESHYDRKGFTYIVPLDRNRVPLKRNYHAKLQPDATAVQHYKSVIPIIVAHLKNIFKGVSRPLLCLS